MVESIYYSTAKKRYMRERDRHDLTEEIYAIGRNPETTTNIIIKKTGNYTGVSRYHLTMRCKNAGSNRATYHFRDEDSKNGTFIQEPLWALLRFWQTGKDYQWLTLGLPRKYRKVKANVEYKLTHGEVLILGQPEVLDENGKHFVTLLKFVYPPVWYVRLGIGALQALLLLILAYFVVVQILIGSVADVAVDPLPASPAPLAIYASDNTTLMAGGVGTPHQEKQSLSEFPKLLVQALLASEDQSFYWHRGINPYRIVAAAMEHLRKIKDAGGASTIDQQLARTLFAFEVNSRNIFGQKIDYNPEAGTQNTIARKIREIGVALKLNAVHHKEQILLAYLNSIDLGYRAGGESIRGFTDASLFYFNKPVENLSDKDPEDIARIAAMVALLRAPARAQSLCDDRIEPSQYEQAENSEVVDDINFTKKDVRALKKLRDTLINLIRDRGYISKANAEVAKKLVNFNVFANKTGFCQVADASSAYYQYSPIFLSERIREEMRVILSLPPEEEKERGKGVFDNYIVVASLDVAKQNTARRLLQEKVDGLWANKRVPHGALITLNAQNGEILALVGEAKSSDGTYDYAATELLPPASTFKLFFYTAALKEGMPIDRTFPCQNLELDGETFPVAEYSGYCASGNAEIDVRNAVAFSDNLIPLRAVKQYASMGEVVRMAQTMGLRTQLKPPDPRMAFGQYKTVLREMAGAYAVIANGGKYNFPHAIREIRLNTNKGNCNSSPEMLGNCPLIYSYEKDVRLAKQVIAPEVANNMTELLRGVVSDGTGRNANIRSVIGKDIAGKTGTSDGRQDGWFIGFVPNELVTGVWLGNFVQPALVTSPPPTEDFNSADAATIWGDYMYLCHQAEGCR
ncbi:MAG: FHA domain-containing protein [Oscillatoriales cyanobacterium SM2_1_8]|nr:FHA domain-containing protein [Oscillatoriales cyanobacterium SM2_1_8]